VHDKVCGFGPRVSSGGRARCVIIDEALLVGVDGTLLVGGTVLIGLAP
jgi:hypothetical protein